MRLTSFLFALLLIGAAAQAADTVPAEGVTPTQCGPADSGSPCGGSGPASQGNTSETDQGAGNPINVITGNKYQQEVDLPALPGVLGLEIVRHYNSSQSDPRTPPGITGRGWKLSYETDLYPIGNTLQIVQADGTRIIFVRDPKNPSQCATNDPARGTLAISKTPRGEEYVWTWTNGRTLSFNHQGKLTQIKAPTGEFVSLARDTAGALVKVTDPQGRSLVLGYPARRSTEHFNGATHIDSPVGRFGYTYGSAVPKGHAGNPRNLLANLVRVDLPNKIHRHYHYETPNHATLLTGLSVAGADVAGQGAKLQRVSTYGYDTQGRGILSVKGEPKRVGKDGKPVPGTGIEEVRLDFGTPGKTLLTNSLNQTTTYTHAIVGNEHRLLKVAGAGCASCGEANIQYGYDKLGRLTQATQLSPTGQPLSTTRTERDTQGRPLRVSRLVYHNGRAQPVRLQVRYEYEGQSNEPSLIARPSVIPGKEAVTRITYNAYGQPTQVTETGFSPLDDNGQAAAKPITRTTTYAYRSINGRSLLAQVDGPLPNGKNNSPVDSDITRLEWDVRGDRLVGVTRPMNLTETVEYDDAGRPYKLIGANGVVTETRRNLQGQVLATWRYPASLDRQAAKHAGLLLATTTRHDILGRAVQITRADGQGITLAYDANGKLARLSDTLGNRVEWKDWNKGPPSEDGNVTTQQWFTADAPAHVARAWYFWHDRQGRLTQRLSPDGGLDEWRYPDNAPDDISAGSSTSGWLTHIDPLGRLTAQARNTSGAAHVRIAPDGEIQARLSATGNATTPLQTQDDFGRIVQFASAQHGTATARYNAAGQIVRIVQADGARIDYALDAAGRPTQKIARRADTASAGVRFRYTAQGLARVEDSAQTTAYDYDALGRQIAKRITLNIQNNTQPGYTIRTRYDASGRIHARQLADGNWLVFTPNARTGLTETIKLHSPILPALTQTLARWFNAPDLPLLLATRKTVVTGIQSNPLDGITRTVHGNGTVTDYRFDQAGRLAGIEHATPPNKTTGAIYKASYQYDAGRRLATEKLVAEKQNASDTTYRYAGWDRLAMPSQVQPTQPATQPQHDPAGRTMQDAQYRYTYDVWGKLQSVTDARADNKIIASYAHNAYGERVKASYGDGSKRTTRYYLYDNQKRIAELDQNGRILQQYFYLNDKPIAVLDSTGDSKLIALHTDRRGASIAASDERGKVIWTASYSAWGRAKVQKVSTAANDAAFDLDLRLPGQWEDRATHLHYNYQRDYNPHTGRYLTPDPLGFPDGPDAYLYVGGDPVNRVDPLGLYQIDIHYYMTYFLAKMAGLNDTEALTMALAAQYIDDNPYTWPVDPNNPAKGYLADIKGAIFRLESYHFTQDGYDKPPTSSQGAYIFQRILDPVNPQLTLLLAAANTKLQTKDNPNGMNPCSRTQLFGEYLHALQDTFGHRDQLNKTIGVNAGLGHLTYEHETDKTYNATVLIASPLFANAIGSWHIREYRTLEMEREVFKQIQNNYGKTATDQNGFPISFESIEADLKIYNAIKEDEGSTNPLFTNTKKVEKLNELLAKYGMNSIPTYNVTTACQNRKAFLNSSILPALPGVILGAPTQCPTTRGQNTQ